MINAKIDVKQINASFSGKGSAAIINKYIKTLINALNNQFGTDIPTDLTFDELMEILPTFRPDLDIIRPTVNSLYDIFVIGDDVI